MDPFFESAQWYTNGINWQARLDREIPVLREVFGPPAGGGILDAGCGPGRQLAAMARQGYRMTGLDPSAAMLDEARRHLAEQEQESQWLATTFEGLAAEAHAFDGAYCLGNALAAAGSADGVAASARALAGALRPGGRIFLQVLNFEKLSREVPAVRGPRVRRDGDREYVSARVYTFQERQVQVTNVTFWHEDGWRQYSHCGTLYAVSLAEIEQSLAACSVTINNVYGSYALDPFDVDRSDDMIVVGTRTSAT